MLEVLGQDYIRTARGKGLAEGMIIRKHSLKNALIPVITYIGLQFGWLFGGTVIIETIFALPGIGRLLVGHCPNLEYLMENKKIPPNSIDNLSNSKSLPVYSFSATYP